MHGAQTLYEFTAILTLAVLSGILSMGLRQPLIIAFLVAGDPSASKTVEYILALERAGADLIEIGIPYSDPVMDGPVIQAATTQALANGF